LAYEINYLPSHKTTKTLLTLRMPHTLGSKTANINVKNFPD